MAVPQPTIMQTDAVTLSAVAANQASPIQKLRNENDVGLNVNRILVSGTNTGGVSVNLRLRNQPITNGFVPFAGVTAPLNAYYNSTVPVFTLALAKPIYLAPGDFIDVAFRNDGSVIGQTVTATMIGCQCAPADRSPYLPYIAAFQTAIYDGTSLAAIDEKSAPTDLGNPFTDAMIVAQFTGRVLVGGNADGMLVDPSVAASWPYFNVRLSDDRSRFLVPRFTPLPLVVDAEDYVWPVNVPLAARSYFKAEVQGTAGWGGGTARYSRAVLGMHGYRRIA